MSAADDRRMLDFLLTGSGRSPGVVTLSGHDLKIGWDIQNANGQAGGTTARTGEPIKEFDAEFYLADQEDFDAWDKYQALLETAVAPGKKPVAIDIFHPDLARNHITSATIGSIGGMTHDGKGGRRVKVHFIEYRPPKPAKKGSATKTEGDDFGSNVIKEDLAKIQKEQDAYNHPDGESHKNADGSVGGSVKV